MLRSLAASLCIALTAAATAQTSSAPCHEPALGTLLGHGDDLVFPASALGTAFPAFGNVYLHLEVSTNGFVWLGNAGNPDSGCCAGTGAALATGAARVAAFWSDLVTDGTDGSGVYHASLPGREVITWYRAFESFDPAVRFTVQLQLVGTGDFTVWFHPSTLSSQPLHTAVCGVSPGNTTAPASTDFSASFPYTSGAQATLFEEWPVGTFDLAQTAIEFLPNGGGGWSLQQRTCAFFGGGWTPYGNGCPPAAGIVGASFYETFTGASLDLANQSFELTPVGSSGYLVQAIPNAFFPGYSNAVPMLDDQVVDQVLPFAFPNPGGVCTTAGFCSNGFVWLDNFNNSAPAAPFVPAFLSDGPRIAALWTDLDLTAGGTAYFDATSTVAYFTWIDAPDFSNPSLRSTFQIQLFGDGRARLCYQGLAVGAGRPVLAGYGVGGASWDPGSIDLGASVPFTSGAGVLPVTLDWLGVPPVLGQTFPLQVGNLRATATLGLLVLGLTQLQPAVPLASLGMPNCFAHTSLDATLAFVATPPATTLNVLTFPAVAALAGFPLFAQAAVFDPGITPFGFATSNGGAIVVGSY